MLSSKQINAYLLRMGMEKSLEELSPDLKTLNFLQRAHLLHVPFENLSIHNGEKIILDTGWLYDKIVRRGRGGFCYELNGLFYALLTGLGYSARLISARVKKKEGGFGPEFDHMAILVDLPLQGIYLVDVGFGRFAGEPLRLEVGHDQRDGRIAYRIVRFDPTYFLVTHSDRGMPYDDDYLFSMLGQDLEDFEEMCRYHQTSPDSHFTQKKLCSRATREGRISLTENKLLIDSFGSREEHPVRSKEEFRQLLNEYCQISIEES